MSLISYNVLVELVERGVIDAPLENINGASIDITLDDRVELEYPNEPKGSRRVNLADKVNIHTYTAELPIEIEPGDFILASSAERFNLPNNIAAEYKLKSSLARVGLQHMLAGWCDPGWQNSKLTLEFYNATRYHTLKLEKGMKIGQMVFWECDPVPKHQSYGVRGQYNNQHFVTKSKGVK